MSVPKFSDFKTWVGKALGKSEWDYNLNKIISFLTGSYDLTAGSITGVSGTFSGNVTASSYIGYGGNLTGIDASATDYSFFAKTFTASEWNIGQNIVTSSSTITSIDAFLELGAGTILTSCTSTSTLSTTSADVTTWSIDTYDKVKSGSIAFSKSGTAVANGGIRIHPTASSGLASAGDGIEFYFKLSTTTGVSAMRFLAETASGSAYSRWDYTSDVASSLITNKWQTFRQYIASTSGQTIVGSFASNNITSFAVEVVMSGAAGVFTNCRLGGITQIIGTSVINVNLYKNNLAITASGQTYTFANLMSGTTNTQSVSLTNATIASGDILRLSMVGTATSATFAGQGLTVLART